MTARRGKTLDKATRVAAAATRTRYDAISIGLHWATAVLVALLFGLAMVWDQFARPTRHQLIVLHLTLGLLLTAVLAWRIVWRLTPGHEVQSAVTGWTERASKAVQVLLYLLLVIQGALGYLARWGGGQAMQFFALQIPPPFPALGRAATHQLEQVHGWLGWTIIILAVGHAGAALLHHFVLHDQVLSRMLPRGRLERTGPR